MFEEFSPADYVRERDTDASWQLLDVREPWEIELVSLPDSVRIPMSDIAERYVELDSGRPLAVLCHSGVRSARVAEFLSGQGFTRIANIAGGIDAWSTDVDNSLPRY